MQWSNKLSCYLPTNSNANTTLTATATTEDGVGTITASVGGVDVIGDTAGVMQIKSGSASHLHVQNQ